MGKWKYYGAKLLRKLLNHPAIKDSNIHPTARCDIGCNVMSSTMGRYSYIGEYTSLSMVDVGQFTSISSNCAIGGGSHPMEWVSMSPVFQNSAGIMRHKLARLEYSTHVRTVIGSDVWIGGNCVIRGGVRIADGAVVGMGSVVVHDIGPYEIWAGNPARLIRRRFDDETCRALLEAGWWNWPEEKLRERAQDMPDVKLFLEKLK